MYLVPRIKCRYSVHNAGNFITGCGDSSSFLWQNPTNCCSDLESRDWSVAHGWCTMTQLLSRRGPLCFPVIMYPNFSALSTCKITRRLTLEHLMRFERFKVRLDTLAQYKMRIPKQRLGLTYSESAWRCIVLAAYSVRRFFIIWWPVPQVTMCQEYRKSEHIQHSNHRP